MVIWSAEIKELEKLYGSFKGQLPDLDKELEQLIKFDDPNVILLYSRRCLEVIITDLCECELKRLRKTEPLKGIIDKLYKEGKVPAHIITSMHGLNELSTYGTHPKDFDPEQVKPVLINLDIIIKWYIKYKDIEITSKQIKIEKVFNEKPGDKSIWYKKKKLIYALASLCVIVVAVILFVFSSGSTLPFSRRDWILITDFENLTENHVFDKSLYAAFTLTTSQSRYINVFPRSRMFETLKRMEIKDLPFIDEKTGKEIALREGISLYIVPSISEAGNMYALATKIMETKSGNLLKPEILYAETQDEILSGIDKLARKIRRDLGESRYNVATMDKPLMEVTTSSLEALKLYSLGHEKQGMADFKSAKDYFERALKIDSGFTAAIASLGNINIEKFDPVIGRKLLGQAVKNVDNLTEREKLGILAFNAARVENDLPKAIEYTKTRIDLYPDDPVARNNLGWYYWNSGDLGKAVKEYKEVIRIDRHVVLSYGSLLWIYLEYLGNADSALVWAKKMATDNPQNVWSYANLGSAWLCLDSLSKAEEAYAKAQKIDPDLIENLYNLAHTYRLLKKYDKSIIVLNHVLDINQNEISAYYNLGVNYACMENPEEARKYFIHVKRIITEERIKRTHDSVGEYTVLASITARLGDMDSSLKMLQKAIEFDSTSHESFAEVFCLYGKVPEALNELEKAFKNGYRNLYCLKTSPDLQILQYDIRLRTLIEKYFKEDF
jgi:tetratricopeptide (TPR) repeat protein